MHYIADVCNECQKKPRCEECGMILFKTCGVEIEDVDNQKSCKLKFITWKQIFQFLAQITQFVSVIFNNKRK